MEIPDDYVKECPYRDADSAARVTGELLDLPNPPTCILYPDDYAAIGGINEIRERGLRIPEDISIVGFDDTWISTLTYPSITTIHQPVQEMCEYAIEAIVKKVKSEKVPSQVVFPVELIDRESTK